MMITHPPWWHMHRCPYRLLLFPPLCADPCPGPVPQPQVQVPLQTTTFHGLRVPTRLDALTDYYDSRGDFHLWIRPPPCIADVQAALVYSVPLESL